MPIAIHLARLADRRRCVVADRSRDDTPGETEAAMRGCRCAVSRDRGIALATIVPA